jgi:glycosyltransferase involved in cell wall biosynthesis
VRALLWNLLVAAFLPVFLLAALLPGRRRQLVWGTTPIVSNRYWSEALKAKGWPSVTVMEGWFSINRREDFDFYFEDFAPAFLPRKARMGLGTCLALIHALRRARVVHLPFCGYALNATLFWRLEPRLFRLAGTKIVCLPFGGDAYIYSRLIDPSLRHGLLASYPAFARADRAIARRIACWSRHADAVVAGFIIDGLPRWDVTLPQMFVIDTDGWPPKADYSGADGRNGPVRVLHTPNHRGFKGTEFLVAAVERLQAEGLLIELVLLEGVPNDEVRRRMADADILAEQFVFTGYALSGIEGMASGLPVMANLDHRAYTQLHRRYAFLDECPVVSTTPETLAGDLRRLATDPELREALGRAGRAYVEKYHGYGAAQFLFESIYARILDGEEVDLINLFHPLKSAWMKARPPITHPLAESRLPAEGERRC